MNRKLFDALRPRLGQEFECIERMPAATATDLAGGLLQYIRGDAKCGAAIWALRVHQCLDLLKPVNLDHVWPSCSLNCGSWKSIQGSMIWDSLRPKQRP